MLKVFNSNQCVTRDDGDIIRIHNCDHGNVLQKWYFVGGRVKLAKWGNWQFCLGSSKTDMNDNRAIAVSCSDTPDDRVKNLFYGQTAARILRKRQLNWNTLRTTKTISIKTTFGNQIQFFN